MNDRDRLAADLLAAEKAEENRWAPGLDPFYHRIADRLIALGWRYEPDTDEDWRRLRKIEKAAREYLDAGGWDGDIEHDAAESRLAEALDWKRLP